MQDFVNRGTFFPFSEEPTMLEVLGWEVFNFAHIIITIEKLLCLQHWKKYNTKKLVD